MTDILSPGTLAAELSHGEWYSAPHLALLDNAIFDACHGFGPDRLIVTMPPRHGKSELCSKYTPAWYLTTFPNRRIILASYGADFASEWGYKARTLINENADKLNIQVARDSNARDRWDLAGHNGGMITAGVGGSITGRGAHLLLIDDPVKDAEQADSPTYRQKTWDWWQSTASSRLEPGGVAIVIQTRWHEDDLAGRLIADGSENWRVINFPAIAEEDDALGRSVGDPLWPLRYNQDTLATIKNRVGSRWWNALYQQRPTAIEGGMFKRQWFTVVDAIPAPERFERLVRYWDKAGTQGGGDYSCGLLMGRLGGRYYVIDVVRGQWSADARNSIMLQTAQLDAQTYGKTAVVTWVEQEPGSGGVESAELSLRLLAGHRVKAERVTGQKETRAYGYSAQCEAGNVIIKKEPWVREYLDELLVFPNGAHDDQVDASSGAFNKLVGGKHIDIESWVDAGAF